MLEIGLGQVVYSKAGRDSLRKLLVVEIVDSSFVKVSDGELRKIEKPKLKKIKHLVVSEEICFEIRNKLKNGEIITNSEIKKNLDYNKDYEL